MGIRNLLTGRRHQSASEAPEASAAADDFIHVVATRLNIGAFSEAWLEYRQELFEVLTLPSIDAQTERDFVWVLGIDRDTPKPFRDRLDELVRTRPHIRLLEAELFNDFEPALVQWCLDEAAAKGRSHILTTRIDSDDALHRELFGEIQKRAREVLSGSKALPAAIMATTGYQWVPSTGQGFRAYHFSHSTGTSLLEAVADFEMVYTKNHRKIPDWVTEQDGSVRAVDGDTRWWLYAATSTSLMLLRIGKGLREDTIANPGVHELDREALAQFGITEAHRLRDLKEPVFVANHTDLVEQGKRLDNNIRQVRDRLRKLREAGKAEDPELVAQYEELHAKRQENARAWIASA